MYKVKPLQWKKVSKYQQKAKTPFGYFFLEQGFCGHETQFQVEAFNHDDEYIDDSVQYDDTEIKVKAWCKKYVASYIKKVMKFVEVCDGVQ